MEAVRSQDTKGAKQHSNPAALLHNFAIEQRADKRKSLLRWVRPRANPWREMRGTAESVLSERGLYWIGTTNVDGLLHGDRIEPGLPETISAWKAGKSTELQLETLASFIVRSPHELEYHKASATCDGGGLTKKDIGVWLALLEKKRWVHRLRHYEWALYQAPQGAKFLTGDSAVARFLYRHYAVIVFPVDPLNAVLYFPMASPLLPRLEVSGSDLQLVHMTNQTLVGSSSAVILPGPEPFEYYCPSKD